MESDAAREKYQKVSARFQTEPKDLSLRNGRILRRAGRELEVIVNGNSAEIIEQIKVASPEHLCVEALTLEEIFVTSLKKEESPI
jgi:hypothetical protein